MPTKSERDPEILAKPKFFDSPSEARAAANMALMTGKVVCSVNDVLCRVDPEEGKWFAIIVLDTDSLSTLLHARKLLPDFRVIGELFPETHKASHALGGAQRLGNLTPPDRMRHISS